MATNTCGACAKAPGTTATCRPCREFKDLNATMMGGLRALETYTAERFTPSKITYDAFIAAKTFNPSRENLYLWGPCGTGKGHLAGVAARQHLPRVATYTPTTYLALLGNKRDYEELETMRRVARVPVLVLNEIGRGADTPTRLGKLFDLIDARYNERPGGLIVTSNFNLDQLAEKLGDDAISSRLAELCRVFDFTGEPDHRLQKRPA